MAVRAAEQHRMHKVGWLGAAVLAANNAGEHTEPEPGLPNAVAATAVIFLAMLGATAAHEGGAAMLPGVLRVTF